MTPEEHLKRMRQDDRWNAPDPKPRLARATRRTAWVPFAIGVGLVAVSAVVIVGAVNLRSLPQHDGPAATPTAMNERPAPRLDLACSDLLTETQVDDFVGLAVQPRDYLAFGFSLDVTIPKPAASVQAGGLACQWSNDDPDDFVGILMTVVPGAGDSNARPLETADSCKSFGCHAEFAVGTTWVEIQSGGDRRSDVSDEQLHAELAELTESISAAIDAAGDPEPLPTSTTPPLPAECADTITAAQMSDAAGQTLTILPRTDVSKTEIMPDERAAEMLDAPGFCSYTTDENAFGITVTALPGAGWMVGKYSTILDRHEAGPGTEVEIPGLEDPGIAILHCSKETADCVLDLTLDGNWISVNVPGPSANGVNFDLPRAAVIKAVAATIVKNLD